MHTYNIQIFLYLQRTFRKYVGQVYYNEMLTERER